MSLVFGMMRKDKFNFVDMFREEAFTAIRATVKQVIKSGRCGMIFHETAIHQIHHEFQLSTGPVTVFNNEPESIP